MIRIKAVDAQNILEVCRLTAGPGAAECAPGDCVCCNAVSIAEAKYDPEMHPNAIYNNNVLVGFFMYRRAESRADTAVLRRFMIDARFQRRGLGKKAFAYVLRGLKIQGVRKVVLQIDSANKAAADLCLAFGFRRAEAAGRSENDCEEDDYTLEL